MAPNSYERILGDKLIEEDAVNHFIREYEQLTGLNLRLSPGFLLTERPDFSALRSDGLELGIETTKIMRDPDSAFLDRSLFDLEFQKPEDAVHEIQRLVYSKEAKRCSSGWKYPDSTLLLLQLMDAEMDRVASCLDSEILDEMCQNTGLFEIWIADFTKLEPFGGVQLFGIKSEKWQGLHPLSTRSLKPYG